MGTKNINVTFNNTVTKDELFKVMEIIFKKTGCLTCGILGYSIAFKAVDPAEREGFNTLKSEMAKLGAEVGM